MLANKLLEKEVIFKEDLEEIFGKRPFGSEPIDSIQGDTSRSEKPAEDELKPETEVTESKEDETTPDSE